MYHISGHDPGHPSLQGVKISPTAGSFESRPSHLLDRHQSFLLGDVLQQRTLKTPSIEDPIQQDISQALPLYLISHRGISREGLRRSSRYTRSYCPLGTIIRFRPLNRRGCNNQTHCSTTRLTNSGAPSSLSWVHSIMKSARAYAFILICGLFRRSNSLSSIAHLTYLGSPVSTIAVDL
ncbi:hypothetical protein LIER_23241 [Lithospermum erythrorhizon]|uniref:Uncharacterized protein n=1 Tax=Lithospermum erythrorhizon TaxID=34254 RepID=A0AAV3QWY7_LITER